jgi:hypothetical protein
MKRLGLVIGLLQGLFEIDEGAQGRPLKPADPAIGDLLDGHWIEVVQAFAAAPLADNQIGGLQDVEVLGHRLAAHSVSQTELAKRLAAAFAEAVEQGPPDGVGQGLEDGISVYGVLYATN